MLAQPGRPGRTLGQEPLVDRPGQVAQRRVPQVAVARQGAAELLGLLQRAGYLRQRTRATQAERRCHPFGKPNLLAAGPRAAALGEQAIDQHRLAFAGRARCLAQQLGGPRVRAPERNIGRSISHQHLGMRLIQAPAGGDGVEHLERVADPIGGSRLHVAAVGGPVRGGGEKTADRT